MKNLAIDDIILMETELAINWNDEKQTYISQIGLYDDDRNLLGIAKLATPVKKTEDREFTFKLKLDF